MGLFDKLFGSSSFQEGDMTETAVKALGDKGIVDPRVYNSRMRFMGVNEPAPKDMKYASAYVETEKPEIINLAKPRLRSGWSDPANPKTLAHEVEHSLAYTGGAELDGSRDRGNVLMDNYASLLGKTRKELGKDYYNPWHTFQTNAGNPEIGKHLKDVYGYDSNYLGRKHASDMVFPSEYEELASDLGGAAKLGKKDIFADPFLQKKLFNNDPYLMEAVRSTLHVEPRMDAKDLQRLTPYTQNVERFKKLIKHAQGGLIDKPLSGGSKLI